MKNDLEMTTTSASIEERIFNIRGKQVMIDKDLALLYGVETKRLNEQVKRNIERFPEDFMFQLTMEECLRSQIATLNTGQGQHLKYLPYAFTEHGIAMLSSVLRSETDITKHIRNIFDTNELEANSVCSILERTASDGKTYMTQFYNLDMILSVGYRVNSKNAVLFRRWASSILKEHLLKGYSISNRFSVLEKELKEHRQMLDDHEKKIDFFVRTSLPPVEGIFFDGQIYDAYAFVAELVRKAARRIVLIDNYIDDTVLTMLSKREDGVETKQLNRAVKRNIERFPDDFMFQLTLDECSRCQIGTLNIKQGQNIKYLPYAFTEYGIAMLSKREDGVEATIYTGKISKQLQLENTDAEQLLGRM